MTYTFKSHEQPAMIGSPGVPDHPYRRKVFYALVGIVLALTGGMQNGLLTAVLPQLQGKAIDIFYNGGLFFNVRIKKWHIITGKISCITKIL